VCEIFTDVPAVFTADPAVVPRTRRLATIQHEQMLEMAEAGAQVLQPRSVELAQARGIDIHLRSSFSDEDGTWIRRAPNPNERPRGNAGSVFVTGIAHHERELLYCVRDTRAGNPAAALSRRGVDVDAMAPVGTELRFTAPGVEPETVRSVLGPAVVVREDVGSVSVIGTASADVRRMLNRSLATLAGAQIKTQLVTTRTQRVTVHVDAAVVHDVARLLHKEFVLAPAVNPGATASPVAPVPRQVARVTPAAMPSPAAADEPGGQAGPFTEVMDRVPPSVDVQTRRRR
jgi:aspartate kinase